ncbi:MAG: DUF503 domain-containing protein [Dehalococcoidia bacterium]|nr:DUF503 domain-containing protein [Dehalococcoidia bacterium]MDW8120431.1 DUF503 domain-containing protein [Chloroflexota bacterium]
MQLVVCRVTLHLAENHSLKGKRHVVQALIARLRSRFNVSVAEVDGYDLWQTAVLGLALVAPDGAQAQRSMEQVVRFIEDAVRGDADVVDCQMEYTPGVL